MKGKWRSLAVAPCYGSYGKSFTMVEVLVVISIVATLMAILLPALQQVGGQAKAVACQNQLRQWGLGFSMFVDEHNTPILNMSSEVWELFWRPYCDRGLFLCPMARRYKVNRNDPILSAREATGCGLGSKFTAWKLATRTPATLEPGPLLGSYGANGSALAFLDARISRGQKAPRSTIPVFLDCAYFYTQAEASDEPPAYDGHLTSPGDIKRWCIDHHRGAINSLFLDWSVQRIGLQELWTLTWSPWFDTHGPWTEGGGIQLEDWPQWMRKFKDD